MKIAVVGSGISGLSAAYYLSKKYKVDLFEKDDHFGGHSYTLDINLNNKKTSVDIGFIVLNFKTYPNLIKFFHDNKIPESHRASICQQMVKNNVFSPRKRLFDSTWSIRAKTGLFPTFPETPSHSK